MDLNTAEDLAFDLMDEHGLIDQGWTFEFSNRKTAFGDCNYPLQRIRLSKPLTLLNTEAEILDTILHEIAHAIAGGAAGHGPKWRSIARQIGARPQATGEGVGVPKAWKLECPAGCGFAIKRHRRSSLEGSCPSCSPGYDARFRLVWVRAGEAVAA